MLRVLLTCLALLALGATPSRASTVIACQDANGQDQTVSVANPCPVTIIGGGGSGSAGSVGAAGVNGTTAQSVQGINGGVPMAVSQSGTTGTDYSANAATIPMSGFVLLATIPAIPTRASAEVQNQSAGTIQVVRDDGAGNNQTTILLASGGAAGTQGGGWTSSTFKGRIRVYGAAGSQIAADQE